MPGTTGSNWPLARVATATAAIRRARDWSSTCRRSTRWPSQSGMQFATVGAGAQLVDVYNQLGASGVLLPGGSCPTVGIAGLALGGGIGVFGRAYGLTCDNIASLTHRDRRRIPAPMLAQRPQRSVLGQSGWGRRQLRHRDVVHLHRPSHPERGAVHPGVALGRGGDRPRFVAALDTLGARRAVVQLPAGLERRRRRRDSEGHRRVRRIDGGLHECPGPLAECRRCGADGPVRGSRGLPPGHVDRGGMRGAHGGPVPSAHTEPGWDALPVGLHRQVELHRRRVCRRRARRQ